MQLLMPWVLAGPLRAPRWLGTASRHCKPLDRDGSFRYRPLERVQATPDHAEGVAVVAGGSNPDLDAERPELRPHRRDSLMDVGSCRGALVLANALVECSFVGGRYALKLAIARQTARLVIAAHLGGCSTACCRRVLLVGHEPEALRRRPGGPLRTSSSSTVAFERSRRGRRVTVARGAFRFGRSSRSASRSSACGRGTTAAGDGHPRA